MPTDTGVTALWSRVRVKDSQVTHEYELPNQTRAASGPLGRSIRRDALLLYTINVDVGRSS